ncbi:hypothetical protein HD592_000523 [Schaalia hyovaginalis]|uniref:Bifunctional metallophosphatase/5'-nucleotidase n=1 Tax=Schaalia hyovaginalis TaxID=29316 RepID=A0A923E104_9ACTO|nr:hypothetical protein [Schaalia hyovaginalis]
MTLDLLAITDFHGHIERVVDKKTGAVKEPGAQTLACEVDKARAANANTLFVSNGDNVGGSAYISSILKDQPTIDVLNANSFSNDVDAFIGGHSHLEYAQVIDRSGKPFAVVQPANYGALLGKISFSLKKNAEDEWTIAAVTAENKDLSASDCVSHPESRPSSPRRRPSRRRPVRRSSRSSAPTSCGARTPVRTRGEPLHGIHRIQPPRRLLPLLGRRDRPGRRAPRRPHEPRWRARGLRGGRPHRGAELHGPALRQ